MRGLAVRHPDVQVAFILLGGQPGHLDVIIAFILLGRLVADGRWMIPTMSLAGSLGCYATISEISLMREVSKRRNTHSTRERNRGFVVAMH